MDFFLRNVCDPGYQSVRANYVGVEKGTVSMVISSVLAHIERSEDWINFPRALEDIDQANTDRLNGQGAYMREVFSNCVVTFAFSASLSSFL